MNPRQILLSLWIIYHLCAVLLTPVSMFPLGERLRPWLVPYVATFEFSNLWEFFSPNPATPLWVDWEAEDAQGRRIAQGVWPRAPEPGPVTEMQMRSLSALHTLVSSDEALDKTLVPYLCRLGPQFHSIRVWKNQKPVARLVPSSWVPNTQPRRALVSHGFCNPRGAS